LVDVTYVMPIHFEAANHVPTVRDAGRRAGATQDGCGTGSTLSRSVDSAAWVLGSCSELIIFGVEEITYDQARISRRLKNS
jgi:hypothetical protein